MPVDLDAIRARSAALGYRLPLGGPLLAQLPDTDLAALLDEVGRLVDAARHLCWLCTEHAGLSEPEDLQSVGDVQRALRALGVDVDPVDEVSGE